MKKIILTVGLFVFSHAMFAQDLELAQSKAKERFNALNTELHFNDEQSEKVKNLIDGIEVKHEYVRTDSELTDDQKRDFTEKNGEVFTGYFLQILNDDQKVKYKEMLSK